VNRRLRVHGPGAIVAIGLALAGAWNASPSTANVSTEVRGFDGSTIKVAGMGNVAQLPGAEIGVRARLQRFNDTNELKGVKIEMVDYADDHNDPATALSEARRLVAQEQVFALVGDTSRSNPGEYLVQNKVPFFGWGFERAYCHPTITTDEWGFGYNGCQVNPEPTVAIDSARQLYNYTSKKLGKKRPTMAIIANDLEAGKSSVELNSVAAKNRNFDVVWAKANVPPPPVGDYSPYVQQLMVADAGRPPDVVRCLMTTECLSIYQSMQQEGFKGVFNHSLYTDILVKPLAGSTVVLASANINSTGIPSLDQLKTDVEKFKPGYKIDNGVVAGYGSTDMFIAVLKKVAKAGTSKITPDNVQKAAAKNTWQMKGFVGPVVYPTASNRPVPFCSSLAISDGAQWKTLEDYSCSTKTFPIKKAQK
jgi:ABC-type branched-subunit amino acid transport system substrate-binding protein